jgi:hypothetical protein
VRDHEATQYEEDGYATATVIENETSKYPGIGQVRVWNSTERFRMEKHDPKCGDAAKPLKRLKLCPGR